MLEVIVDGDPKIRFLMCCLKWLAGRVVGMVAISGPEVDDSTFVTADARLSLLGHWTIRSRSFWLNSQSVVAWPFLSVWCHQQSSVFYYFSQTFKSQMNMQSRLGDDLWHSAAAVTWKEVRRGTLVFFQQVKLLSVSDGLARCIKTLM